MSAFRCRVSMDCPSAIFIFGGETIRGFSFALLIGIVIGTYSSICIATPIVIDFEREKADVEKK